ncbi:conserved hypothetical protein [Alteromonas sp. 38]|nr:conserved hypothetical protein [Alteromonas sp. 154]VXB48985.1 conserved hypothetical protein [Alteromonas sp. 38]
MLFAVNANNEILLGNYLTRGQFTLSARIVGKASVLIKTLREKTR